jgi:hypothetical protein
VEKIYEFVIKIPGGWLFGYKEKVAPFKKLKKRIHQKDDDGKWVFNTNNDPGEFRVM